MIKQKFHILEMSTKEKQSSINLLAKNKLLFNTEPSDPIWDVVFVKVTTYI